MVPHRWDVTPSQAIALQRELASRVRIEPLKGGIETVAGADCAFVGSHRTAGRVLAAAVLCDAGTLEVIAASEVVVPCAFPYVPGLLSFREAPAIIKAVRKLPRPPDLLFIDGQGLAHPRGFGVACHVGLLLDVPTIGAAKSRLCGEHRVPGAGRGSTAPLMLEGRVVGAVVRTRSGVRPMFVSVGHRVTLEESVAWTVRCAVKSRLPQTTRLAHQFVTGMKLRGMGA